jgi:medium-chain acyl-[acyl-carrier-protein] hydrolase
MVMQVMSKTDWLVRLDRPGATVRRRIFLFPYAGGGPQVFRDWAALLGPAVEVVAVQLPGRGRRLAQAPMTNVRKAVELIADAIAPHTDLPYAFFGHSMGALLSFEIVRSFRELGLRLPSHLFVSACRAPTERSHRPPIGALADDALVAELRRLGGTPPEILDNDEFLGIMLPILRADCLLSESYAFASGDPLNVPITAFAGTEDTEANPEMMQPWALQTIGGFTLHALPGNHFFIHGQRQAVCAMMSESLDIPENG